MVKGCRDNSRDTQRFSHNVLFRSTCLEFELHTNTTGYQPWLNSTKLAEFITPTMALFAIQLLRTLKKGDIIMFAMGSSCPDRVAPRADRCLGGQFACAPMCYGVFSTIVDVTNGGCGC